jgi:hypothetical protein
MFAEGSVVPAVCTAGVAGKRKKVIFRASSSVGICGKWTKVKTLDGVFYKTGDFGPVALLRETLQVNHQTFREALNGEKFRAQLTRLTFTAILKNKTLTTNTNLQCKLEQKSQCRTTLKLHQSGKLYKKEATPMTNFHWQ